MAEQFDIVVIGGGHAGAEAAYAAARVGAKTAMVTLDAGVIGQMSCNPAIGGVGKGQIVREIDALGGLMGLAADATGIQFRMLNASKGPAVHGPRCQSDRHAYARWIQRALAETPNLTIIQAEAKAIVVEDGRVVGVRCDVRSEECGPGDTRTPDAISATDTGRDQTEHPARGAAPAKLALRTPHSALLRCHSAIITAGTFLRGVMHCGADTWTGGRIHEPSADGLSGSLAAAGLELGRLKTGTCPRIDAATIDYDRCTRQDGDAEPAPFSFLHDRLDVEQIPCWLTATNEDIHDVVRANFHRAPLYTGQIQSTGPRYCPSFEAKIERFADKTSHQVFLEPEGRATDWVYCNGISTSLPRDVQNFMVNHIAGLEKAVILQYGYAIEYDFAQPTQVRASLETHAVAGLYLAGQILGTTGYEEAAGLGLLAGLNAARALDGQDPLVLRRDEAYLGVMVDDLVTKGVTEPYRMFTSRAEHRLLLRADNADRRLTTIGRSVGLVDDDRWARFAARRDAADEARRLLNELRCDGQNLWRLLRRPGATIAALTGAAGPDGEQLAGLLAAQPSVLRSLEIDAAYDGYVEKQAAHAKQMQDLDSRRIPRGLDYAAITQLRWEAREKLAAIRPMNLGQALRISGITPADVSVLAIHLAGKNR